MKKLRTRDNHRHTDALVEEARGVAVAELRRARKRTVGEVFRERERSGFFKNLPKGDWADRFFSEGRGR